MASILMHLYVGKKFAEKHKQIVDLPQFYLGCITPDSVNADGFASKDIRWAAHIRASDIKEWYDNNIEFYHRNIANVNNDLLLGYVIHNITDAAYDEFFNFTVWNELKKINKVPISSSGIGWDDCFRFDFDQRKEPWWMNEVSPALKESVPTEINGINRSYIEKFVNSITDERNFTFPEGNPVMVTIKMVNELSEIVCKIVDGFI